MSARTQRRKFANPFVITLTAIPACAGPAPVASPTSHDHDQPHTNPPPPKPEPEVTATEPAKLPQIAPSTYERRWTVVRTTAAACDAYPEVRCPMADPSQPTPTCNPPRPFRYVCPADFKPGDTLTIVLRANETECFKDLPAFKCPTGKPGGAQPTCNPPAPVRVTCPM